jgi:hypothetical protein
VDAVTGERDNRPIRVQYDDVLSRLNDNAPLDRETAIDEEIERVSRELLEYLSAYREVLRAEAIHRALNKTQIQSAVVASGLYNAAERIKAQRLQRDRLENEHVENIGYLKLLLSMRTEIPRGA